METPEHAPSGTERKAFPSEISRPLLPNGKPGNRFQAATGSNGITPVDNLRFIIIYITIAVNAIFWAEKLLHDPSGGRVQLLYARTAAVPEDQMYFFTLSSGSFSSGITSSGPTL